MRDTQWPGPLQITHEDRPMLLLSICYALVVPALDGMPALRHVLHLGENVLNEVRYDRRQVFANSSNALTCKTRTIEFHARWCTSSVNNSQVSLVAVSPGWHRLVRPTRKRQ